MIDVVQMEITKIIASVRTPPKTRPAFGGGGRVDLGADGVDGGAGMAGAVGGAGDSAGGSGSGSESAAEEAGDAEESASAPSGEAGSGLIDTRNVGADPSKIDTPVTSSGNSSLWIGEDGLGETPGGDD